jgi:diguanylate cyclase (GGDEF)-like protein
VSPGPAAWLLKLRVGSEASTLDLRTWHRRAASEVRYAVRKPVPLAVAIINLDSFNPVNGAYEHLSGDEAGRQVGQCLGAILRQYDLSSQFGGGEFVVLLPRTRASDAFRIAERVRARIARLPIATQGGGRVTVSIGVAAVDEGSNRELTELLAAADAALYRAKTSGRGQVQMISTSRGLSAVGDPEQGIHAGDQRPTRGIRRAADFAPAPVPSAVRLVTIAAQALPPRAQSRYVEEFGAELQDIACAGNGRGPQLRYAVRQFIAALQLRRELRGTRRRTAL